MKTGVFIIGGLRTPFVRSFTSYSELSTQSLMEISLTKLVEKYRLEGKILGDVALGAVISSSKNWNLARECVLSTKLSANTPAYNIQRACGTGLEAAFQLYSKMALGLIDSGIAGGVDSNSAVPLEVKPSLRRAFLNLQNAKTIIDRIRAFSGVSPKELIAEPPVVLEPRTGLSMGQHCELMVKEWGITQREQDEIALRSQLNASMAFKSGFYSDLVIPTANVERDSFVRDDTSIEKLTNLKPAFDKKAGTITAGNASPLSDGSSCVLMGTKEWADQNDLQVGCQLIDFQVAAVDFVAGEGLLMAPTLAVAKLLSRNNVKLSEFDFYEIHEAFAGQVACTLKAWDSDSFCKSKLGLTTKLGNFDVNKMNVVGGSIALGHPFAATGGRILGSLAKILRGTEKKALISICTAGGMGIAAIVEGAW